MMLSRVNRMAIAACFVTWYATSVLAQDKIRIATYNIEHLHANIPPERVQRLQQVIAALDADVIGMQEIKDRAALEKIFDTDKWQLVIDDESDNPEIDQDLAVAVRKPLKIIGLNTNPMDFDADDDDFLFPENTAPANVLFPSRRDVLMVRVELPEAERRLTVLVHHAKSRRGGRDDTDGRREAAAHLIVTALEERFDEQDEDFVLLGDLNDNADDKSVNIFESGLPTASGGPNVHPGSFLVNLTTPLVEQDHVSWGLRASALVDGNARVNTIVAGSRQLNNQTRGTDGVVSPILFDQILVPPKMLTRYSVESVKVLDDPATQQGHTSSQRGSPGGVQKYASDHNPVVVEFTLIEGGGGEATVRIASALPNPAGPDAGNEKVSIKNSSPGQVSLAGWLLRDRSGRELSLTGTIAAGATRTIAIPAGKLPLGNSGDDIELLDDNDSVVHRVTYTAAQAASGAEITFAN